MQFDVVIIGGGPAGLSAALALGRSRRRVLLADSGPRRNAAAEHMHNFVTQDGTPPEEFRRIGRAQLAPYPVDIRDERVESIRGASGAFDVVFASGPVRARRILLATGMVDELPPIPGLAPLWGTSVHICPYCHGWEVRDQRWGYFAKHAERLTFALLQRAWTKDVVVFTEGLAIPPETAELYANVGITVEDSPIAALHAKDGVLETVELAGGKRVPLDVLFMHPAQRQVGLVSSLGLATDAAGYLTLSTMNETSVPGIYAGGDLATMAQSAISAANAGVFAAAALNHSLALDDARLAKRPA